MLGKMDAMLGKQDKTIEILEAVKGDTSKMLEKQDETIKNISFKKKSLPKKITLYLR